MSPALRPNCFESLLNEMCSFSNFNEHIRKSKVRFSWAGLGLTARGVAQRAATDDTLASSHFEVNQCVDF
jgi:hypothetical protein